MQRRCLVPAEAFYEWKAVRTESSPNTLPARMTGPIAFAGESFR